MLFLYCTIVSGYKCLGAESLAHACADYTRPQAIVTLPEPRTGCPLGAPRHRSARPAFTHHLGLLYRKLIRPLSSSGGPISGPRASYEPAGFVYSSAAHYTRTYLL